MLQTMKQPVVPEIKRRKKFDRNFKQQAVTLWINSGKSASVMAAELGLRDKQLYEWQKVFASVPGAKLSVTELEAQNLALRRDNDLRSEERRVGKECRSRWS